MVTLKLKSDLAKDPAYTGTENEVGSCSNSCPLKEDPEQQRLVDVYFEDADGNRITRITKEEHVELVVKTENMSGEEVMIDLPDNAGHFKVNGEEVTEDQVMVLSVGGDVEKIELEVVPRRLGVFERIFPSLQPTKETKLTDTGSSIIKEVKDAFFAQVVDEKGKAKLVRIDEAYLGQEVYVAVHTGKLNGTKLKVNIEQLNAKVLTDIGSAIVVEQNGKEVSVIEAVVGEFANANNIKYANHVDFTHWALVKVTLAPSNKALLKKYISSLDAAKDNMALLGILVDAHSAAGGTVKYSGKNPPGKAVGHKNLWLDAGSKPFKLKGTTIHIHHDGKISKMDAMKVNKLRFKYHEISGASHDLGEFDVVKAQQWKKGPSKDGTKKTPLIKITFPLSYNNAGVKIKLADNTDREYINPEAYACLLGAIAEVGYDDITFNGFTSNDGKGSPSVSHYNGIAGDLRYLRKDKSGGRLNIKAVPGELDVERQESLIDALVKFGWSGFYSYKIKVDNKDFILKKCSHLSHHDDHLHLKKEGFSPNYK